MGEERKRTLWAVFLLRTALAGFLAAETRSRQPASRLPVDISSMTDLDHHDRQLIVIYSI